MTGNSETAHCVQCAIILANPSRHPNDTATCYTQNESYEQICPGFPLVWLMHGAGLKARQREVRLSCPAALGE